MGAVFAPAYTLVRKHEGYYLNDPDDVGGETYGGVARKIHPYWSGWPVIDRHKHNIGRTLATNEVIPTAESHVETFFRQMWARSRAGEIKDQRVAEIFFDFYILASKAVATMQMVLNVLGRRVTIDNKIGPQTIAAINSVNPEKLYMLFKKARIAYHIDRVKRGLVSAKFLPGWIARTNNFPDLNTSGKVLGIVAASTLLFTILYKPSRTWMINKINQAA